jgi:heterodisulfide reductase subunit C
MTMDMIQKEGILDVGEADSTFKYEVASRPGGEKIKKCFSCGTCTSACPVFRVEHDYNPRRIIRLVLLGFRKEVLSSRTIWLCAHCYACSAYCPQGVSFADIMTVLQRMAVESGYVSADLPERIETINLAMSELRKEYIKEATAGNAEIFGADILKKLEAKLNEIFGRFKQTQTAVAKKNDKEPEK